VEYFSPLGIEREAGADKKIFLDFYNTKTFQKWNN